MFKVVIPARYASTRLPGKPLLDIAGKPMVIRVADQASKSQADEVVIATDFEKILAVAEQYTYAAVMTRIDHASGTDRIAEVVEKMGWHDDAIVVNVQGDEPLIDPKLINEVALTLAHNHEAVMATACHPIHDEATFLNPNVVKVVMDANGNALYFSRAPIPYPRDDVYKQAIQAYRHIGIYAYRVGFLKQYAELTVTALEKIESLEQLRVLYHGYKIAVSVTDHAPASGVDTEQDLAMVRDLVQSSTG
ncbi:3-deoxy-D-manno-octulosonate cytidylyltransferase [Methylophilaceae bacterium 11]|uniref:3-deoxy-manno-octulosonate cytidylyltransferase n=1 Tax=Methylotenera sp. N17 TaxID=1502761 RepID=UPI00044F14FC|nr:3-deoxy-manno-octulosonate cytidylyltransferase [Methylotenera sp. N17]EUJ09943.1 3-deoxy-D-manno-octulosonate cytidylyltransferase [Methylophilaceae bacterium 11]